LNASEYLDLEEERRNGPKSIIRLENCGDNLKVIIIEINNLIFGFIQIRIKKLINKLTKIL